MNVGLYHERTLFVVNFRKLGLASHFEEVVSIRHADAL